MPLDTIKKFRNSLFEYYFHIDNFTDSLYYLNEYLKSTFNHEALRYYNYVKDIVKFISVANNRLLNSIISTYSPLIIINEIYEDLKPGNKFNSLEVLNYYDCKNCEYNIIKKVNLKLKRILSNKNISQHSLKDVF